MVQYNLKKINVVPNGEEMVDIVLSRTRNQTPIVVHKGYALSRLRMFYMRKVKYTQQSFREKLWAIMYEFPRSDDVLRTICNKDRYEFALGQVNTARNSISQIAKDYVKLLKYGDSLYRCKYLKVAALGSMCAVIKLIGPSLAYLEQVRQDMARLPSIEAEEAAMEKHYCVLTHDCSKEDIMAELVVDPDILHRLVELERAEGVRLADGAEEEEFEMDVEEFILVERARGALIGEHGSKVNTAASHSTGDGGGLSQIVTKLSCFISSLCQGHRSLC